MSAQTATPTSPTLPNLFHTPPILPSSGAIPDNDHMEAGYEFQRREGAPEAGPGSGDGWLFCPPVVTGQLLGAGCVTFQGRLGLAIQGRPMGLMERWLGLIRSAR